MAEQAPGNEPIVIDAAAPPAVAVVRPWFERVRELQSQTVATTAVPPVHERFPTPSDAAWPPPDMRQRVLVIVGRMRVFLMFEESILNMVRRGANQIDWLFQSEANNGPRMSLNAVFNQAYGHLGGLPASGRSEMRYMSVYQDTHGLAAGKWINLQTAVTKLHAARRRAIAPAPPVAAVAAAAPVMNDAGAPEAAVVHADAPPPAQAEEDAVIVVIEEAVRDVAAAAAVDADAPPAQAEEDAAVRDVAAAAAPQAAAVDADAPPVQVDAVIEEAVRDVAAAPAPRRGRGGGSAARRGGRAPAAPPPPARHGTCVGCMTPDLRLVVGTEHEDDGQAFELQCKRVFCKRCFSSMVTAQLEAGEHAVFRCVHEDPAATHEIAFTLEMAKALRQQAPKTWERVARLEHKNKYNSYYVPCPTCNHDCLVGNFAEVFVCTELDCINPRFGYCMRCRRGIHARDPPHACDDPEADRLMLEYMGANGIMPCPGCKHAAEKRDPSACNHISCLCGTRYCGACGYVFPKNERGTALYSHRCNVRSNYHVNPAKVRKTYDAAAAGPSNA